MSFAPGPTWNLDSLFPEGCTSEAFAAELTALVHQVGTVADTLSALPAVAEDIEGWRTALTRWFDLTRSIGDREAAAYCYNSAHTEDPAGRALLGRFGDIEGVLAQTSVVIDTAVGTASSDDLDTLATGSLDGWRDAFEQTRKERRLRLAPELEDLLAEADREARHGWGQLYDTVTGTLTGVVEVDGESRELGIAQLGAERSNPDPAIRKAWLEARDDAYDKIEDVCAAALTHLTGTRQMRLDRVGAGPLDSSLIANRMDVDVLDAMFEGAQTVVDRVLDYVDAKGVYLAATGQRTDPALAWFDASAPVGRAPGGAELSWAAAQELIVDAFDGTQPALAEFSRTLLRAGGVEAEARSGKRSGGYCVGFSEAATSRIFMTFTGSVSNAITLAHELGHAWHNEILYTAPEGRRQLTNGLAESASNFAESIVRDRILSEATDPDVRLFMLDQQLSAASAYLVGIPSRYRFERSLYDLRREGPLSPAICRTAMDAARHDASNGRIRSASRNAWAGTLHYYISQFGFYNWPYTFGYLFSSAISARARAEGPTFHPRLVDLLTRTGWQDCRSLARDTLDVDLADPTFWADAAAPVLPLVDEFEALSRA